TKSSSVRSRASSRRSKLSKGIRSMVDAEIRKRLREVSAAASKGPWTHQRQWCPDGEYWAHFVHTGEHVPLAWNGSAIDTAEFDEHDAAFVAEANPTMVIAIPDDLE